MSVSETPFQENVITFKLNILFNSLYELLDQKRVLSIAAFNLFAIEIILYGIKSKLGFFFKFFGNSYPSFIILILFSFISFVH